MGQGHTAHVPARPEILSTVAHVTLEKFISSGHQVSQDAAHELAARCRAALAMMVLPGGAARRGAARRAANDSSGV
jgi:hypothetical protein